MKYYIRALKNYKNFRGRSRRREYWWFFIINTIIVFLIGFLDGVMGTYTISENGMYIPLLRNIYTLIMLIPGFAVFTRRMQDINKGWKSFLLFIIPFIGQIIMFVWLFKDSHRGFNKFGPNPKDVDNDNFINRDNIMFNLEIDKN